MPSRIVTLIHRPKRPPSKLNAVALDVPAIVRKRNKADVVPPPPAEDRPPPANDGRKPAIVTAANRKQAQLRRAEERAAGPDDPEAEARVQAFFARMIRPP